MRRFAFALLLPLALWSASARADYRVTRDHGGLVDEYKAKYAAIRDRGERVIIDGICNSACTWCWASSRSTAFATPRASLGFHLAYYDKSLTFGMKVTSYAGHRGSGLVLSGDREGLD